MLRKRSRTAHDRSKGKGMGDLNLSSCFSPDSATEHKARSSSFFSVPGLLVNFTGKALSESDSMRSPTSPLDYRIFSNLSNFASPLIRTPRSPGRSWDCGGVGLGLVNSLGDAERKNVLLGSQMRLTSTTTPKNQFSSVGEEHWELKASTFCKSPSSKFEFERNFDASSDELFHGSKDIFSASEDYTCIISHGPNPKTTHMFGDQILENCMIESQALSERKQLREEGGSHWIILSSAYSPPLPSTNFLSRCYFCDKKLEEGRDIYMYRGEKAFCSWNCREQVIFMEEESSAEKLSSGSCHFQTSASFHEDLTEGMTVITPC